MGKPLGAALFSCAILVAIVHLVSTYLAAATLSVPACKPPADGAALVSQYLYDSGTRHQNLVPPDVSLLQ